MSTGSTTGSIRFRLTNNCLLLEYLIRSTLPYGRTEPSGVVCWICVTKRGSEWDHCNNVCRPAEKKRLVRAKKIVGHVPKEVASFGWLWTCWSKRESSSGWTTHGGKVTTPLRMMPCNRAHYPRVAPEWVATEVCGIAWGRNNESFILVTRRKNIWKAVKTAAKAVHWNTKGSWRGEKCQHKSNLCRFSCCFRHLKHLRGVSWNEWTRS